MNKKILLVFWGHPYFDGRCMNMINQSLKNKDEITVLGVGNKAKNIEYKNVQITLIDKKKLNNSVTKYFKYFKCVKKFINMKKADVIIAGDLYSMIPIAQIKDKHQAKIIYDSRELYTKIAALKNRPILQKIWSYYEKKYIYKVDYILVTANIDKNYLLNRYGTLNIYTLKNFPSEKFLNPKPNNLKKLLCIEEKNNILIYQGKFHEGRGIRFVIQALAKIKNVVLVLIGDGPMKYKYIETARNYQIADKLFFIDAVPYEELSQFTVDADIGLSVIQPISKSYEHALPNKLFEYAVTGVPTICSNLIAMNQMIKKYNTGIAINPDNEIEFINAYKKINNNNSNYILSENDRKSLLWSANNHLSEII